VQIVEKEILTIVASLLAHCCAIMNNVIVASVIPCCRCSVHRRLSRTVVLNLFAEESQTSDYYKKIL